MTAHSPSGEALVVYCLNQHPLRSTLEDHLYAFREHGAGRYHYLNLAVREVPSWLRRMRFDAVIYHNSFLSQRWVPELFDAAVQKAQPLKGMGVTRIALPQDEFLRADMVSEFIHEFEIDSVFSVAPESEWPKIYPNLDRERVRFHRVLTGYLSEETIERINRIVASSRDRPIDVGYRSMPGAFWLGRHGMLKRWVAERFGRAAVARGLTTDISTDVADVLFGDDWFRFLAACKYTPGVEGGASVLDRDGAIKERTERYLSENPGASFGEVERNCFPGDEGAVALYAASPRHLEACATRTCQVLVEGEYSGVLEAGTHYLELRRDLSNLEEVLDVVQRDDLRARITAAAHRDVVASGRYTYDAFVRTVEKTIPGWPPEHARPGLRATVRLRRARLADRLSWVRVIYRIRAAPRLVAWRAGLAAPVNQRLAALGRRYRGIIGRSRFDPPGPSGH